MEIMPKSFYTENTGHEENHQNYRLFIREEHMS